MRGVILAGGLGSRLGLLTKTNNKHLLPIYDKPMIYYPLDTLIKSGIKEILIILSGPHAGNFMPLLKNGEELGCKITYAYQHKPDGGIADALGLAEDFAGSQNICCILGDNTTDANINSDINDFLIKQKESFLPIAKIFLKSVEDPSGFGVVEFDENNMIKNIIEKPVNPPSNSAVTGLYLYDNNVFKFIKQIKPSSRNQLEVTDINNMYLKHGLLLNAELDGFWQDAGTYDNLWLANKFWAEKNNG